MMLLTGIILALVATAFVCFWNYIRDVLNNPVRDMLRKHYGAEVEQWFVRLLVSLDEVMVTVHRGVKILAGWTKEQLRGAWLWFGETFLGVDTTYLQIDNTHLSSKTKSVMRLNENDAVVRTEETILRIDELPDEIQEEMKKQNADRYRVNEKDIVERQYKEKLELFNH